MSVLANPVRCGTLTVVPLYPGLPLFPEGDGTVNYLLAHEAMAAGTLIVREVSAEGSVCWLIAENLGDLPVFIPEGLELTGAKQNRGLVTSVLLAGNSSTRIPVCCVQRKRWTYSSRQFSPGSCCPPSLRTSLQARRAWQDRPRRAPPPGSGLAGNPAQAPGDGDPFRAGKPVRFARHAS